MAISDYWNAQEIDQLRDDLEDAEIRAKEALAESDDYLDIAEQWQRKCSRINNSIDQQVKLRSDKINEELKNKSMIYLSLINEYESILHQYESHSPVKLTTSSITNLRKRGGLIV